MEEIQALNRLMSQVRQNSTISRNTKANYKCTKCRDTTWVETENGFVRCECYAKDKVKRLWENFGISLDKAKRINEYSPYDDITEKAKNKAVEYIRNFSEIVQNDKNCFGLFGQNGAGKTHLVVGIGVALLNQGIQVTYMPYVEATKELKLNANSLGQEYYMQLYNRYTKAKVLIIDDLFKDKTKNGKLIADMSQK